MWATRRVVISAFVVIHLGASLVWAMPECLIRQRLIYASSCYLFPLGLWQCWTMFAPDPIQETVTLEASVTDINGLRYGFAFPTLADKPKWRVVPMFRHPKYTLYMVPDEKLRGFAARHVVRQLGLPAEAFPVDVQLYYQLRRPPPLGELSDPMAPVEQPVLGTYRFNALDEVHQ
jgi:hypothetical protein